MNNNPEQPRRIPINFDAWVEDSGALEIGGRHEVNASMHSLVDAVNEFIRENPGEPLPRDFFMAHMARVMSGPRSLGEIRDDDK